MNSQENSNIANAHIIYLSKIKPSKFNPRKTFRDADLTELADSIREQGVLQPIMVRPIGNEYEIVYGERRYRAALLAGLEIIPVLIRELSDSTAMEYALTENLQRTDVSPIEEATAYHHLIDNNRYDTAQLMLKFGKSESYIRSRIRLNSLIPELVTLLEQEEINLATATELSKYSAEVQADIYTTHFESQQNYNSWRNLKAKEIAKRIEQSYTTDLNNYFFDKTACYDCQYNSNNQNLFADADGCGNCSLKTCLKEKNISFLVNKATEIATKNPTLTLCHAPYRYDTDVVAQLTDLGYDISELRCSKDYPTPPIAPDMDEYDTDDEYEEVHNEYETALYEYTINVKEVNKLYEEGKVTMYAKIEDKNIILCYRTQEQEEQATQSSSSDAPVTPLAKLEKQDARNRELSNEKIIDDTKRLYKDTDLKGDFTLFEENLTYFGMLSFTKQEHFAELGITEKRYHLCDDDKLQIIHNLTDEMKNTIRRDFIVAHLKDAFREGATENLLLEFTRQHLPQELTNIETKHNEVYDKRHEKIVEKIEVIKKTKVEEQNDDTESDE